MIREGEPISRHKIATRLNLSRLTVSRLVGGLVDAGFVRVDGNACAESTGGRRPTLFQLSHDLGFIVGVEIQPDFITALLLDVHLNIEERRRQMWVRTEGQPSGIGSVMRAIHELMDRAGVVRGKVLGIGLACPGSLDIHQGIVSASHILGPDWHNVPIKAVFENEFNLPVFLEHDVRAMAWAERQMGIARGVDNLVFVGVGAGVGAGIVVDGRLLRGACGNVGELGHIVMDEDGPRCGCGNLGCLEAFASIPAVLEFTRSALEGGTRSRISDLIEGDLNRLSFVAICRAAEDGDRLAVSVVGEMADMLGRAVAMVVTLFDPELIVLGRDVVHAGDMLLNRIRHIVKTQSLEEIANSIRIENSSLGPEAGALGAAIVVHDRICDLIAEQVDIEGRFVQAS